jgi:hypothetical protein
VLLESTTLQTAIEEGKLSMDPENPLPLEETQRGSAEALGGAAAGAMPLPLEETQRRSEEFSSEEESS